MVFGLPAERFMSCFAVAVVPVFIVLFLPIAIVLWIPWIFGTYYLFQNMDRFYRIIMFRRQFPGQLKNR